ncbi:hypothetical protein C2845_PM13G04230 [Panicum miliaceum]|uniref:Uncharacterized protein n=1 Tax=Panicum miliaceum TaxID=4540 RepID=A0A3L6RLR1_PANMI|nr:hypothetical protein C2845_PM13G04230 [Panicum miliaceum]
MRSSMVFGSVTLLLLATIAHGLWRLDVHAAPDKKVVSSHQGEIRADFKWQQPPPSSGGTTPPEDHASTARAAAAEEDGEMRRKKTRALREVAPRLIHEDYAGPSGHSPNHQGTILCGPC